MSAHKVRPGGLMRCCTHTVAEHEKEHPGEAAEGTVLPCLYCKDSMILRDGAWEWNR